MNFSAAMLEAAGRHMGVSEWPGARHNPVILGFFEAAGHKVRDDETPWCAAFVGAVLAELGLPGSGALNARSYLSWGAPVAMADARPGDVVVLWRGDPKGWQGHVGFFVRWDGSDQVILRGGNQGNAVSDAPYPVSRILGIRAAISLQPASGRPILQMGDKGRMVRDLQGQLLDLGYALGAIDGAFGARTRAAVLAFQADNDLVSDGIVGALTWAALPKAAPRAERKVTVGDLKERGSRTIREAERALTSGAAALGVTGLATAVQQAKETAQAVQEARGALDALGGVIGANWQVAALVVAAVTIARPILAIIRARVDDAVTGMHSGR